MTELDSKPREIPAIIAEEDTPVSRDHRYDADNNLSQLESLNDRITQFKYVTGRRVLYISMGVMIGATIVSIILSCCAVDNELVQNLFEVFKLIAMTVLGYIFGSKTT